VTTEEAGKLLEAELAREYTPESIDTDRPRRRADWLCTRRG